MGKRSRKRREDATPAVVTKPAREAEPAVAAAARPARQSRSEAKNAAVRAQLVPLEKGERPGAVTVGAVLATVLALGNLVLYLAGVKVGGQKPAFSGIVGPTVILGACAYGMWRAKYWAVLGMEALLGIAIVAFAVLLPRAANVQSVAIALGIILVAGTLFYKLIKAMARIQMPQRPEPRR